MSLPYPLWKKLFGRALHSTVATPKAAAPDWQDRACATHDAARMLHQLRARAGLTEEQFAARLGMLAKDVLAAETGTADYQHTMDMRDRAQTILGYAEGESDVQPQAERRAASRDADWIRQLPD